MQKFKAKLTLLLLAMLTGIVHGQNSTTNQTVMKFSLKEAVQYALENNYSIKNSVIDLELAKKKIWETTAIGLPQVNAQANYQHLFKVPELSLGGTTFLTTDLPAGTLITADHITNKNVFLGFTPSEPIQLGIKDNTTLDITLSQLIFSGEYLVGLQASKVFYQMSDQSKLKTQSDLKESVSNTYSLILTLEQSKISLNKSLDNLNVMLVEMREMYKQGFIENTDVDQIELTTLTLTNSVNAVNRQVRSSKDLLKFQLNIPFENDLILTDSLGTLADEISLESALAIPFDINHNINYKILQTQEKLSVLNLKREKSGYLPNLAAVYRHTEKVNQPAFDFTPKDVFALSMNIPIFSSGQRHVKVQQRKLELEKVLNSKDNVASGLALEFDNTLNEMSTAYESFLINKKNIELTNRVYEKTLLKYKEGLSTSLDVTTVQNQYLKAQADYYTSVYTLITAQNKFNKLTEKL